MRHCLLVAGGPNHPFLTMLHDRNATLWVRDMTSHPVTLYRHRADLSLWFPLLLNVRPDATTTCFLSSLVIQYIIGPKLPLIDHCATAEDS